MQAFVYLILKSSLELHVIFIIITSSRAWLYLFSFLLSWEHLIRLLLLILVCLEDLKTYSLLSSLNHPHQSKITFVYFYSDTKEKLDLALKAVVVKYKYIFILSFLCTRCCCVTFFLTPGKSQSHYFITLPNPPVWNFLVIPGGQDKEYFRAEILNSA